MNPSQLIFQNRYTDGRPFVRAKIVIVNPETGRQTTIEKDFKIDTGFDGGIHVAQACMDDIRMIGIDPAVGTYLQADGIPSPGHHCHAYLQQVGDYNFPMPGIEAELVLHGRSRYGLLGLEILRYWIAKFDGPNDLLTIHHSEG